MASHCRYEPCRAFRWVDTESTGSTGGTAASRAVLRSRGFDLASVKAIAAANDDGASADDDGDGASVVSVNDDPAEVLGFWCSGYSQGCGALTVVSPHAPGRLLSTCDPMACSRPPATPLMHADLAQCCRSISDSRVTPHAALALHDAATLQVRSAR